MVHDLSHEDRRQKWDKLAATWTDTGPPATPSADDLRAFAECALHACKGEGLALILGSTIGLRRLFTDHDALKRNRVICCDWSRRMYEEMGASVPVNPFESFVEGDWLTMDIGPSKADIIMGDKAIDNVPVALWPVLFSNLWNQLKVGGRLVLHVGYVTSDFRESSFRARVQKWVDHLRDGSATLSAAAAGLWEDCLTGSAFLPGDPSVLTIGKYSEEIEEFGRALSTSDSAEGVILYRTFVEQFGSSFRDTWASYTRESLMTYADRYFVVEAESFSGDYDAAPSQPILEFGRRDVLRGIPSGTK